MIPTIQTIMVLATSATERAKALMYLVMVTPVILNNAIEKIPKIQKNRSPKLELASAKYI